MKATDLRTLFFPQETEALEEKKTDIQLQIQQLQAQKEELEVILASHAPCCRLSNQSPSPNSFLTQDKVCLDGVTIRIKQEPNSNSGSIPTSENSLVHPNKRIALGK